MGVILDSYDTPYGQTLTNVYASFANNPVTASPTTTDGTKTFSIQSRVNFYVSAECRRQNKLELATQYIIVNSPDASNVFATLYEEVKRVYPNAIDDDDVTPPEEPAPEEPAPEEPAPEEPAPVEPAPEEPA